MMGLRRRCKPIRGNVNVIARQQKPPSADPKTTMVEPAPASHETKAAIEYARA